MIEMDTGSSLVVQWLGPCAPTTEGLGSIPEAMRCGHKKMADRKTRDGEGKGRQEKRIKEEKLN